METLKTKEGNETARVVVEKILHHPISKVWKALTEKDQMVKWFFPVDGFKPQHGFEFRFPGQGHKGEQYMHVCRVTEIVPGSKLQFSWQYEGFDGYSVVTVDLFEMPQGNTKLVLTHEGLQTFPANNPDFATSSFNEGWNYIIGKALMEYLDKQ